MTDLDLGALRTPTRFTHPVTLSFLAHGFIVCVIAVTAALRPARVRPRLALPMQVMAAVREDRIVPVDVPPPPATQAPVTAPPHAHEPPPRHVVTRPVAAPTPTPPAQTAPVAPPSLATSESGADSVASAPSPSPAPVAVNAPVTNAPVAPPEPANTRAAPGPAMDVGAYLSAVTSRVSRHRTYPAMALEMGQEGEVRVRVVVNPDGTLAAPPTVEESSGHELLDQEAVRIVARAAPFPPLTGHQSPVPLRVPVQFHIDS